MKKFIWSALTKLPLFTRAARFMADLPTHNAMFWQDQYGKLKCTQLITLNLYSHIYFSVIDEILQLVAAGEWINKLLVGCEEAFNWLPRNYASRNVNKLDFGELACAHLICKLKKKDKTSTFTVWYSAKVLVKEMLQSKDDVKSNTIKSFYLK